MSLWWKLICLTLLLASFSLLAQAATQQVAYQQTKRVPYLGATAAYSLDPNIAEASAAEGILTLTGKGPGQAQIVVVTRGGIETIDVLVPAPPPSYPPGFEPPLQHSAAGENASYEFRYSSDPAQWFNSLTLTRHFGENRSELRFANANMLQPEGGTSVTFPLLSYLMANGSREIIFLDSTVNNTPLTADGAIIRGLHWKQGGWAFHAGVAEQSSFHELLLSTGEQVMAGVTREFRVSRTSSFLSSLYFFPHTGDNTPGTSGAVGSVAFRYRASDEFQYELEAGVSRGVGAGGNLNFDNHHDQVRADFRYEPAGFASLGVNEVHGTRVSAAWSRQISQRLTSDVVFGLYGYDLPKLKQTLMNFSGTVRWQLSPRWIVNGGLGRTQFSATLPQASSFSTFNVPLGLDFAVHHFGAGVGYQYNLQSYDRTPGQKVRANARLAFSRVSISGFAERETAAPALQLGAPQNSLLADSLQHDEVIATGPQQIAAALRTSAVLVGLGYLDKAAIGIADQRMQFGGSLMWAPRWRSRDQASYTLLDSRQRLAGRDLDYLAHTLTYTRRLSANDDLSFSMSLFSDSNGGQLSPYHLRYEADLRHHFSRLPSFLVPGGRGVISGHVFLDPERSGRWAVDAEPVADAEVVLDGDRRVRTSAKGFYSFEGVAYGEHSVEVKPGFGAKSEQNPARGYYFTSGASAHVQPGEVADFGIAFASAQIFGYVLNDAGEPVPDVLVQLTHESGQQFSARTSGDGEFTQAGVPDGRYEVRIDAESVPAGYWLAGLKPQPITARSGSPAELHLQMKAVRGFSGRVLVYDRKKGAEVGVSGAKVRLREFMATASTDRNGSYRFRDLPAGHYTVEVTQNGHSYVNQVTLGAGPVQEKNVDLEAGAR